MGRFSKGKGSCGSGGRECRLEITSCILGDVESEIRFFFVYCHRGKRKRERGQSIARRSNWRPVGAIRTNSRLTVTLLTSYVQPFFPLRFVTWSPPVPSYGRC